MSPELQQARVGKVTASAIALLRARTKSGWAASRANYMAQLLTERLTGKPSDSFSNAAMQWGVEHEPEARDAYAFEVGQSVDSGEDGEVGFFDHPEIELSGASPDGLVGESGLVEIKCPNTATHIDTLLSEKIAGKYIQQMQWQMACTGREWCDFVSYDPRLPVEMMLFVKRVHRDTGLIAEMEADVRQFQAELRDQLETLRARFMRDAA